MQWGTKDYFAWHQVPFAWWPSVWDNKAYWLEYPPVERRAKFNDPIVGYVWEYRDK